MHIKNFTIYSLLMGGLLSSNFSQAQHNNELYNDGALIHVQAGAEVHVWGDLHMTQTTGLLENDGLIKVQGNMYSDALFEQRGTGTTRIDNSDVNTGERQFISGSYAVRGGTSATGVDDGSFYNLELANDQGIVYLVNSGAGANPAYVADVRNQVNFLAGTVTNRIVTHDIGTTGAISYPANGSSYNAEFGMMNTAAGLTNLLNNTATINGNMSGADVGYVQGKHRRAIAPAGGTYGFLVGLEPAGVSGQRGFQYIHLDLAANTYDVIRSYFEAGSPNNATIGMECSGYQMDDFWGDRHGEWIFDDINNVTNGGQYDVRVWPQDPSTPFTGTVWTISKDDVFQYPVTDPKHNDCGPSTVGLDRGPFEDFSQFGVLSATILLDGEIVSLEANAISNKYIEVDWYTNKEKDLDYFEVERSLDNMSFNLINRTDAVGTSLVQQDYSMEDFAVLPNINYYYRIKRVYIDGSYDYTHSVVANLVQNGGSIDNVNIYPNPVSAGDATIEVRTTVENDLSIVVYDAVGQLITYQNVGVSRGLNQFSIQTQDWAAGVYFVHFKGAGFSLVKELIKATE